MTDRVSVTCPACGRPRLLSEKWAEHAVRNGTRCGRCGQEAAGKTPQVPEVCQPPSVYLPGLRCGKWTLVERREGKRGLWRCDCGREKERPLYRKTGGCECEEVASKAMGRRRWLPCCECGVSVLRSPSSAEAARNVRCSAHLKAHQRSKASRAFGVWARKDLAFRMEEKRRAQTRTVVV